MGVMASLPQSRPSLRAPRIHLEGDTPTVLRFANGQNVGANLQRVSVTGGLLSLAEPVVQGSRVGLMFRTESGPILGGAEMLRPVSDRLQPFRFIALADDQHRRLQELVWQWTGQNRAEAAWMDKLRTASSQQRERRGWRFKVAHLVAMVIIGLATTAAYLLHLGLLK